MTRDWSKLTEHLEVSVDETVTLTLDEIVACVGALPDWVRSDGKAWTDDATHAFAWTQCSRTVVPRLSDGVVDFVHTQPPALKQIKSKDVRPVEMKLRFGVWECGKVDLNKHGRPELLCHELHGPGVYALS